MQSPSLSIVKTATPSPYSAVDDVISYSYLVTNTGPFPIDQPITIGPVQIRSGDYVLGDRDGMVILPAAQADEIVTAAETAINTESLVRKAILEGVDPQEAYLKYGKF